MSESNALSATTVPGLRVTPALSDLLTVAFDAELRVRYADSPSEREEAQRAHYDACVAVVEYFAPRIPTQRTEG
jgi:hypothetical protein